MTCIKKGRSRTRKGCETFRAAVAVAKDRGLTLPIPEDVTGISGAGVIGPVDGLGAGRVDRSPATSVLLSDWRNAGHVRPYAWPRP